MIAMVDVFQTVWIAGWKQKEHPMLQNVLHIGDQLLSVAGNPVTCSTDAHKLIRAWPSLYVSVVFMQWKPLSVINTLIAEYFLFLG